MFTTTSCPECGQPAEVIERFILNSTAGPVEHIRALCIARHHFLMPVYPTDHQPLPEPRTALTRFRGRVE